MNLHREYGTKLLLHHLAGVGGARPTVTLRSVGPVVAATPSTTAASEVPHRSEHLAA